MKGQTSCCYPFPMLFKLTFPNNNVCRTKQQVNRETDYFLFFLSFFFPVINRLKRKRTDNPTIQPISTRRKDSTRPKFHLAIAQVRPGLVLVSYQARSSFNPCQISRITLQPFLPQSTKRLGNKAPRIKNEISGQF